MTHDNAIIDFLPADTFGAVWDAQYLVDDNSNFEGGTTGDWAAHTNASSITNTASTPFRGTKCLQWTATAGGNTKIATSAGSVFQGLGRVVAARVYTARCVFRPTTTTRSCEVDIEWYTSGSTLISTTSGSTVSCPGDVHTRYEADHTAPATAVKMRVVASVVSAGAAQTIRVDDIQVEDKHTSITNLVRDVAFKYGRTYITDQFETGTLSLTCNTMSGEFDSDFLGTTNAISFIGAGTASSANNASTAPTIHASTAVNDFMLMADTGISSAETPGNVVVPTGWNLLTEFNRDGAASPRLSLLYRFFQTGDTTPTVEYYGLSANDLHISQIATFRNVHPTDSVPVMGVPGSNGAATNLGPIPAINTSYSGGATVVVGARGDDWTSVATLSGDSLTWVEIGEPDSTTLDDGGLVWDYALIPTGPQVISTKTFTVTGGSGTGVGIIISLKPTSSVATAYAGSGKLGVQTQIRARIQAPAVGSNARVIHPGIIGNVESIVQEWDAGNKATIVNIQCADLMRVLQNATIPETIEGLIAVNDPLIHLPLMEDTDNTIDPSNLGVDPAISPVWANKKAGMTARITGLMLDTTADLGTRFQGDSAAVAFDDLGYSGVYFSDPEDAAGSNALLQTSYLNNWTMGFWVKANSNSGTSVQESAMITLPQLQLTLRASSGAGGVYNQIRAWYMSAGVHTVSTAATITASTNYFVIITKNSLGLKVYLGTGSAAPTIQATFGPSGNLDSYTWDASTHTWGINIGWGFPFGTTSQARFDMAQFFMIPTVLNTTKMAQFWAASKVMYPEENTGSRLNTTVLDEADIPTGRRKIDTGRTTVVTSRRESGVSLLDYAQSLNSTELGLFYCNSEGVLIFENKDYLPLLTTTSITLGENVAGGEVPYTTDYHPSLDIEKIFTRVVINLEILALDPDGGPASTSQHFQKDTSANIQEQYGIRTHSQLSFSNNPYQCDDIAQYLLNVLALTSRRVDSVPVIPDYNVDWPEIMERKIGDKLLIKRRPNYFAAGYLRVYQIESIDVKMAPGSPTYVTWSLTPVWTPSGFLPDAPGGIQGPMYWILGTSILDTNTYLGY